MIKRGKFFSVDLKKMPAQMQMNENATLRVAHPTYQDKQVRDHQTPLGTVATPVQVSRAHAVLFLRQVCSHQIATTRVYCKKRRKNMMKTMHMWNTIRAEKTSSHSDMVNSSSYQMSKTH